ncbi:hypothetical protein [Demequina oxidasica]|uniref:hypothetical protein n=1 Tax=Demequina oxidasica TaxID=676199 RepID=UPI001364C45F|nr:hypothetical protein [Demequina oxidasica]
MSRPTLRLDVWATAGLVLSTIEDAQFGASVRGTVLSDLSEAEAIERAVAAKYWDN